MPTGHLTPHFDGPYPPSYHKLSANLGLTYLAKVSYSNCCYPGKLTLFSFFTFSSRKAYLTFCSRFSRDPSVSTDYAFEKTNCTASINQVDCFHSLGHVFSTPLSCYPYVKCFTCRCLQIMLSESVWLELMLTHGFFIATTYSFFHCRIL